MNIIQRSITADRALRYYGTKAQRIKTIEELGELITALAKFENNLVTDDHVIDELADVLIMISQMAVVHGMDRVENQVRNKLERLKLILDRIDINQES